MHTPDTSERRGGLKATASPSRSGRRDRHGRSKPGVDLSHQTLAKPEPRRDSAETGGCAAAAWRSGARRLNRNAGQEPKGAKALPVFRVMVSARISTGMTISRTGDNTVRKTIMKRLRRRSTYRMASNTAGKSGSAGGAFALPVPRRGWRFLRLPR